ncbi:MAG: T9SS type A sorting domain-containing protein [Flavobacteriales bacterium]|nr:T9SS type A sorting domain-containing protein [Flavobacteriales bacterium]
MGITPAMDGSYYIYGAYHGYDDGTTNDTSQRLISRLYGLNVGIHEQEADQPQPLQIAPNPSAGSTVFSAPAPLSNTELYIHDGSGRLVWQVEWPAGAEQYTLPAGALAPGAYVVRVAHAGTVLTCKCPVDLFSTIFKPPKEVAAKHYPCSLGIVPGYLFGGSPSHRPSRFSRGYIRISSLRWTATCAFIGIPVLALMRSFNALNSGMCLDALKAGMCMWWRMYLLPFLEIRVLLSTDVPDSLCTMS